MPVSYNLTGGGPWGFRLVGGKEFRTDLSVSRVTPGGKAAKAGITPGLVILEINGVDTKGLTHLEAQNKIKTAGSTLNLLVETSGDTVSKVDSGYSQTYTPKSQDFVASPSKPSGYQTQHTTDKVSSTSYKPAPKPAPTPTVTYDEPLPPPPPSMLTPQVRDSTDQSDPICEGCGKAILGPYLSHKGKNWHVDEFVCAARNCRKSLQSIGFVEENGERYCKDCYEKHFAHSCGKCRQKIIGEVMHALNQTWHMTCFVCEECRQPFTDGVFQMQNDKAYCVTDYNRLFSQVCKGCNFPVEAGDRYLEAIGASWHETCFHCAVCHIDLKNVGFFAAAGKPVCSNHRNARFA